MKWYNISIMKKGWIKPVVIIVAIIVLIAGLFVFSPLKNIFTRVVPGVSLEDAIQSGKIEVLSDSDASSYFTFVSMEEAKKMLADAEAFDELKFLMPQFDIPPGGLKGITIRNEDKETDGGMVRFLTVSGLPAGTMIYTNSDKFGQGGITSGDSAFAWYRTRNMGESLVTTTYMPAHLAAVIGQTVLLSKIDDIFREIPMGSPIFKLATDLPLDENLFPVNTEVAYSVSNGEDKNLADLKNLLMKDGKIVMVER